MSATAGWLVAHPASVKSGTLPGGVAEVTLGPAAAGEAAAAAGVADPAEAAPAPSEAPAALAAPAPGAAAPMVPDSEETETLAGRTRPNSWKAWAQSKRESTSELTAFTRCSRMAAKLVNGAS